MLLIILYLGLFLLCGFFSSYIFVMNRQEDSNQIDDLKLNEILINISKDENFCFHCIQRQINFDDFRKMIDKQRVGKEREQNFKNIRALFNTLSIINSLVIFCVFGESKLIFFLSILGSSSIFISIYIGSVFDAILFESCVILMSVVVLLKTCYVIFVEMIIFARRKSS